MTIFVPRCFTCTHLQPATKAGEVSSCPAFPNGIPAKYMGDSDWKHSKREPDQVGATIYKAAK